MADTGFDPGTESFVRSSMGAERWEHTQGVVALSERIGEVYSLPRDPLLTAALFHDNARNLPRDQQHELARLFRGELDEVEESVPGLWHAPAGAQRMLENFDFIRSDTSVQAVAFHTTATPDLSQCLQGLLVADFAEPNRSYPEATEVRSSIGESPLLDLVGKVVRYKLTRAVESGHKIHERSIRTHNKLCD